MKRARPILRLALVGESADSSTVGIVTFKVAELTHRCLAAISKLREELNFIFREQLIQRVEPSISSTEPQLQQLIQRVWLSFATQRLFGRWLDSLDELFSEDG